MSTFKKKIPKIERVPCKCHDYITNQIWQNSLVIENITASVHITYYAHITPSYPTLALKGFDVQNSTDSVYIVYTLLPVAEQTQYVHVLYQLTMLDVHKRYWLSIVNTLLQHCDSLAGMTANESQLLLHIYILRFLLYFYISVKAISDKYTICTCI